MKRTTVLVVTAAVAGGAILLAPVASAMLPTATLHSVGCTAVLTRLATAQKSGPAGAALIDESLSACSDGSRTLPKAQYAVVRLSGSERPNPVGLVFAWTDPNSMTAVNQEAPTFLLINGVGIASRPATSRSLVQRVEATATFGGRTYRGTVNASDGDGGQSVVFAFGTQVGKVSKAQSRRSAPPPRTGEPLVVYSENGPIAVKVGPVFAKRYLSVNRPVYGVVTAPDGTFRGESGQFMTGRDSQAAQAFWTSRAYYEPYQGVLDHAIG